MSPTDQGKKEIVFRGIAASPGIVSGPVHIFEKHTPVIKEKSLEADALDPEIQRLRSAVERSRKELAKIYEFAKQKLGDHQAKIFEAQLMILEDLVLFDAITKRILAEQKNAEYIVHDEIEKYRKVMVAATDEYTR
ncbi:MAG: phosphoenolpyruvate--protein phosphotransferase, partial [Ignavibacteriales bacterium]|nr:phosphoenolpyruvate--protein phosphotransferase [Ignavibacteriales bacterium]